MKVIFTSYRESRDLHGIKFSMDRHSPKMCSYPTLPYLVMPLTSNLTVASKERICLAVLDNNWDLLKDLIEEMYGLGLRQIALCDWATIEQITYGKFCSAGIIGRYIQERAEEFEFEVEVEYGDGRDAL